MKTVFRNICATTAALLLAGAASSTATADAVTSLKVKILSIDDAATVVLNGSQVLACNFGQVCSQQLAGKMVTGVNKLTITVTNNSPGAGYTYDILVLQNGNPIFHENCGVFNTTGCSNSDLTQGTVREFTFYITK